MKWNSNEKNTIHRVFSIIMLIIYGCVELKQMQNLLCREVEATRTINMSESGNVNGLNTYRPSVRWSEMKTEFLVVHCW